MIIVDGHVHIYPCFEQGTLFEQAAGNFRAAAAEAGCPAGFTPVMLLAERSGDSWFETVSTAVAGAGGSTRLPGGWQARATSESGSLCLTGEGGQRIFVLAGRQIISREGLEVLGLMTADVFEDGPPAASLIEAVAEAGGVAVIPWAFGKWFGARGKLLGELFSRRQTTFYLGDNGGRPAMVPLPGLLRRAAAAGAKILSGSDPLPLPGAEKRVGSFGFTVDARLDPEQPAAQLRTLTNDPAAPFSGYGRLMSPAAFIMNQFRLRLNREQS